MKIFMESIDMGIWDAVVSGPFVPMQVVKEETVKKPWSDWSESEKMKEEENPEHDTIEHHTSEEEENPEHDEILSLLTKKFSRFLKRKNRDRSQQRKMYSISNDSNSSSYTCFGCGKPGHIKIYCANNQNKEKPTSKKSGRGKEKRAYMSWEENEVSSTSDSSTESEEANLCFMVNDEGSIFDSVSDFSTDSESYDQLLIAFKETHDEANKLVVICNKLNKVNKVLEPKVKSLEEELHKAKIDIVSLELTCLHASIKICDNCKKLEKQVEYLLKTLSNFTKGRENLETLLGSQNAVFNKNGLGYNPGIKNNVKKLSSFFVPSKIGFSSFNSSNSMHTTSCFYCMKSGHISRTCKARRYPVPKGLAKWLLKERY